MSAGDWDNVVSVSIGIACAFLIMGMAGCTTLSANAIKDAVVAKREQHKQQQCDCTPQPHPGIVVIINENGDGDSND